MHLMTCWEDLQEMLHPLLGPWYEKAKEKEIMLYKHVLDIRP